MDQAQLRKIEARCTQEAMPTCRAKCPLRLDVRAFMERMAAGDLREARKLLERHLPLPAILTRVCDHPCEDVCLRRNLGGSLAVGRLEEVCMQHTTTQTRPFPRTPKSASVAVLGAGLSGLVVAFELSRKAYPVTIFHEATPHTFLKQRFPDLPSAAIDEEYSMLAKTPCTLTQATLDKDLLARVMTNFAAVFMDADAAADLFCSLNQSPDPLTGQMPGVGHISEQITVYASAMPQADGAVSSSAQAGDGRRAAQSIERQLSGVSLNAERENELVRTTPLHTPLEHISAVPAVFPARSRVEDCTLEAAQAEAARCIRCQCLACVRECVYLKKYGSYPRSYARQMYNNAAIVKGEHQANSLINGCTLCGQCTELCPERFSMSELCLLARRDMVKRAYMPPSAHEFALEDMESANSEVCALFLGAPEGKTCSHVFFPGCQLAASRGDQVLAILAHLRSSVKRGKAEEGEEGGVGLFLHCCGVPAHWAGREQDCAHALSRIREQWEAFGKPIFIVACASCLKTFQDLMPDITCTSLWELLAAQSKESPYAPPNTSPDLPGVGTRAMRNAAYVIHDPCAARHNDAWQKAVRHLASKAGISYAEPELNGTKTACCGYGGLVWCAQPDLADAMTQQMGENLQKALATEKQADTGLPGMALASCIMCRDRLVASGTPCLHMLDIVHDAVPALASSFPTQGKYDANSPGPGLSARRANRARLRLQALHLQGAKLPPIAETQVLISSELLAELERKHILRQDVEQAVLMVESQQRRFLEVESGHYVGAFQPRHVCFWVRYSPELPKEEKDKSSGNIRFRLHDAWCHRMIAPGVIKSDKAAKSEPAKHSKHDGQYCGGHNA